jgi:hypothetical protein
MLDYVTVCRSAKSRRGQALSFLLLLRRDVLHGKPGRQRSPDRLRPTAALPLCRRSWRHRTHDGVRLHGRHQVFRSLEIFNR